MVENPSISVEVADSDESYNHVFNIRTTVFVDEESVDQEDEYDGFDHLATHYLARIDETPAGTARWRVQPTSKRVRLERFAVLKPFRRKGIGSALLQKVLSEVPASQEIYVHVQPEFQGFFAHFGFDQEGEPFEEAGMPHWKMVYRPSV